MKRVGTVSAAAGFIFLGVWMIINQRNPYLGEAIFRWWPAIIILLGLELMLSFSNREENQRTRFNGLIIPVILLFLFVNVFREVRIQIGEGVRWLKDNKNYNQVIDILRNIDDENYKVIQASKTLDVSGVNLILNSNNGDITINKSPDGKIKLDGKIYVARNSVEERYDIKEKKESDGYRIDMTESYIKKVKLDISVPDGLSIRFEGNNLRLISDSELTSTKFFTDINNASIDVSYASSVNFKVNNGKLDIKNVRNVEVKSNNSVVNINGNSEIINLDIDNGMVSVDNKICRNVNIRMDSGTVKVKTEDQNADVKLQLEHGPCSLNGERRINAGISKTFGSGENKLKVDVDNGVITFIN